MKCIKAYDFTTMQSLDRNDWNIETGDKWHNQELQRYTNQSKNRFLTNEGLVIRATYQNGVYDSARINTRGKFAFQYGRVDVKAKVPKGRGTWAAVWMMSDDRRYGFWPKSGEIDIFEHIGNARDAVYMCLHTERYNHTQNKEYFKKHYYEGLSDDFHTFSLYWDAKSIEYFIDDESIVRYEKGMDGKDTSEKGWPFDHPFHLIINLAIGGTLGGSVDESCFPQDFVIQSIKVYQ